MKKPSPKQWANSSSPIKEAAKPDSNPDGAAPDSVSLVTTVDGKKDYFYFPPTGN